MLACSLSSVSNPVEQRDLPVQNSNNILHRMHRLLQRRLIHPIQRFFQDNTTPTHSLAVIYQLLPEDQVNICHRQICKKPLSQRALFLTITACGHILHEACFFHMINIDRNFLCPYCSSDILRTSYQEAISPLDGIEDSCTENSDDSDDEKNNEDYVEMSSSDIEEERMYT